MAPSPTVPACPTDEPCVRLGDALREIAERLSVSRSTLYNMGMHRELRVHACRPADARPAGRSVFIPQSAVDEAVDRVLRWLPSSPVPLQVLRATMLPKFYPTARTVGSTVA